MRLSASSGCQYLYIAGLLLSFPADGMRIDANGGCFRGCSTPLLLVGQFLWVPMILLFNYDVLVSAPPKLPLRTLDEPLIAIMVATCLAGDQVPLVRSAPPAGSGGELGRAPPPLRRRKGGARMMLYCDSFRLIAVDCSVPPRLWRREGSARIDDPFHSLVFHELSLPFGQPSTARPSTAQPSTARPSTAWPSTARPSTAWAFHSPAFPQPSVRARAHSQVLTSLLEGLAHPRGMTDEEKQALERTEARFETRTLITGQPAEAAHGVPSLLKLAPEALSLRCAAGKQAIVDEIVASGNADDIEVRSLTLRQARIPTAPDSPSNTFHH